MNKKPGIDYINSNIVLDKQAIPAYKSLIEKIKTRANEIIKEYDVSFSEKDPYKTSIEMVKDLKNKKIKVYSGDCIHPVFSEKENVLFRLVHDVDGHGLDLSFSLDDEIETYKRMVKKLLLSKDESRALYTEIVGQVTAYYITKEYQIQKAIFIN